MRTFRRPTAGLALAALATVALTGCGSDDDGDAAPRDVVTVTQTPETSDGGAGDDSATPEPAPAEPTTADTPTSPPANGGGGAGDAANSPVLAAATTAVAAVPQSTLFSVDRDDRGGYDVTVVTPDGVEHEVLVSDDGGSVTAGPTEERDDDDADDLAERQQLLADVRIDHERAVAAALAESPAGELSDLDLDIENGRAEWQVGFGDDTSTEQTVYVDAVSGDVVGSELDD